MAVNAFYVARGRLPGDIKNIGTFGDGSGYNSTTDYPAGTFESPYKQDIQSKINAPFIEMYFEKVSDFEPKSGNFDGSGDYVWNAAKQGYLPISNVLKTSFYNFENFSSSYSTS